MSTSYSEEYERTLGQQKTKALTNEETKFIWCLVGNVTSGNNSDLTLEINKGTKHFSANTKVYCLPIQWGDGYEKIKVIARHRKTSRNVCIVMQSKFITNWRIQKVYRPSILESMHLHRGWTNSEQDKERILQMLKSLPIKNSSTEE